MDASSLTRNTVRANRRGVTQVRMDLASKRSALSTTLGVLLAPVMNSNLPPRLPAFILGNAALWQSSMIGWYILHDHCRQADRRLCRLALFAVGLHYLLYVVYSYFGGMLAFVLLVEVWTIPLIGLGFFIIRKR